MSPRYIVPFEVRRRVGEVAYELTLALSLSVVHPVFQVSTLKKYVLDGLFKLHNRELDIRLDQS